MRVSVVSLRTAIIIAGVGLLVAACGRPSPEAGAGGG